MNISVNISLGSVDNNCYIKKKNGVRVDVDID